MTLPPSNNLRVFPAALQAATVLLSLFAGHQAMVIGADPPAAHRLIVGWDDAVIVCGPGTDAGMDSPEAIERMVKRRTNLSLADSDRLYSHDRSAGPRSCGRHTSDRGGDVKRWLAFSHVDRFSYTIRDVLKCRAVRISA